MERLHRREVGFLKTDQQIHFVDVQQVFVPCYQDRDLRQRSFGKDNAIVDFCGRQMSGQDQSLREFSADGFGDRLQMRFQFQQIDAPFGQIA